MNIISLTPENPGEFQDGDLQLELVSFAPHPVHKVPTYHFRMVHAVTADQLGDINLRVGFTPHIERYAGHIGFSVYEPHHGHRYATRSVRLLIPLTCRVGLNPLWITCDPENLASRRTLELAGAQFVEIVNVPENCMINRSGHPRKCRYRLDTEAQPFVGSNVFVRQIGPHEQDAVRVLVRTVSDETFADLFAPSPVPLEEADWSPAWVAVSNAKIVGVVLTHEEWISNLWVLRESRGQGVGKRLLEQGESEIASRGHHTSRLRVVKSNNRAVQFYLHRGWQVAREFPHEKFCHAMLEMLKTIVST
jgi:GNAT superfamily N-acetyltransferase